ncbi:hypothetical protein QCA50_014193 [Cerrena zonata]|uniref:FLZ-type domain-containing protein n=1 Tax=Cerrena zonata TaxID=2478898 RepID=A0AAW0FX97_9APHY
MGGGVRRQLRHSDLAFLRASTIYALFLCSTTTSAGILEILFSVCSLTTDKNKVRTHASETKKSHQRGHCLRSVCIRISDCGSRWLYCFTDSTPRRRTSTREKKPVSYADQQASNDTRAESPLTDLEGTDDVPKIPAKRRRKKDVEPVVYDIPPVESKETTFKGRLGYACLNTILRLSKPDPVFCSRTCRKDTIHKNGIDFPKT